MPGRSTALSHTPQTCRILRRTGAVTEHGQSTGIPPQVGTQRLLPRTAAAPTVTRRLAATPPNVQTLGQKRGAQECGPLAKVETLERDPRAAERKEQRRRRVTARRQRLVGGRDRTLAERIAQIRPGLSFLQINRVKPSTQSRYVQALEQFLAHWMMVHMPSWTAPAWDAALQDHVELLYESGKDRGAASRVVSAVLWLRPELGQPMKTVLPHAFAALRGWRRLEPGLTRPPLPYAIMMAMVVWLARRGRGEAGLLIWMLFETYLRVNEALTMHGEDVVLAAPLADGQETAVTVMACSSARQLASKTGEQDLSLALDLPRQTGLADLLARWAAMRGPNGQLWTLSYPQLRSAFQEAAIGVGAEKLGASLHSLRHGGASQDRQSNARSLLGVQLRGAWRATASLQRYEKFGLLAKELGRLNPNVVTAANTATSTLLLNYVQLFEPLFGTHRANDELFLTSFRARVVSAQR